MKHLPKSKATPKMPSPIPSTISFTFSAIGTSWVIDILEPITPRKLLALKKDIKIRIEAFDQAYSRFRQDSLVAQMATQPGRHRLPSDAAPLLALYSRLYQLTGGLMTPLIGDTIVAAGYDANYSLRPKQPVAPITWDDALVYDFPYLTIKQPVVLDFGAAGKGYLVDLVADCIEAAGVANYCVNAGGDIVSHTVSVEPLTIALEHPDAPDEAIGVAGLHNQSLCGSAGNRRAWGPYHHIINPDTLASPVNIKAVWVVADSGLLADGLSTALFFTSAATLSQHFVFEYALVYVDGSLEKSNHFPAEFFTIKPGEAA